MEIQGLEFQSMVQYTFYALVSYYVVDLARTIKQAKNSIETLNIKVGIVVEKITGQEKSIDEHNERLKYLERSTFLRNKEVIKPSGGENNVGN